LNCEACGTNIDELVRQWRDGGGRGTAPRYCRGDDCGRERARARKRASREATPPRRLGWGERPGPGLPQELHDLDHVHARGDVDDVAIDEAPPILCLTCSARCGEIDPDDELFTYDGVAEEPDGYLCADCAQARDRQRMLAEQERIAAMLRKT
jgi:hypothetical protein